MSIRRIGFGGGCHWCTEAVFQVMKGVRKVDQGWIASIGDYNSFSEAVVVDYDSSLVTMKDLLTIHVETHNSTSYHSMRSKYRSAVYFFDSKDEGEIHEVLEIYAKQCSKKLITLVLPFLSFKRNSEKYIDYFRKNPEAAFCERYIVPKLKQLSDSHPRLVSVKNK